MKSVPEKWTGKFVCKEDGQSFPNEFEAFRHNLSHGRLATQIIELRDYFDVNEVKWEPMSQGIFDAICKKAEDTLWERRSPFDPKFLVENQVSAAELELLAKHMAVCMEYARKNPKPFHDYLATKMANQVLGIKEEPLND